MSATQIKLLAQSARHYKKMYLDQIVVDAAEEEPTRAMRLGRMIHMYLLEPDIFKKSYAFLPDKANEAYKNALFTMADLQAKAEQFNAQLNLKIKKSGKKDEMIERLLEVDSKLLIWDRHVAEICEGKEAITVENQGMLLEIFDAVKTHPFAMKLISSGIPEVSGYWHDDELDLKCKFRTDWINDKGYIIEVKSTADARKKKFFYKIRDMRYDIGAAWYVRGYRKLMNKLPKGYVWMVVETKPPYSVALYSADESCLSAGEFGWDDETLLGFRDALDVYKKARAESFWPGFQTEVEQMSVV